MQFMNVASMYSHGGTMVNGEKGTLWPLAPKSDAERYETSSRQSQSQSAVGSLSRRPTEAGRLRLRLKLSTDSPYFGCF